MRNLIVISGLSGAGKSTALGFFEDSGYFCMDNVPPVLIDSIYDLVSKSPFPGAAIVVDARGKVFGDPVKHIKSAKDKLTLIFLEASTEDIVRRYSLTRRSHPLGMGIEEGVLREKEMLSEIREMADFIVDTSGMTHKDLRDRLRRLLEEISKERAEFTFRIKSFAFKHGIPSDSDFIFDARFFPNPYYIPELSAKTGLDPEIEEFFKKYEEIDEYIDEIVKILKIAKSGYENEGRTSLFVSIGCSGGRHRSVYIAKRIGENLRKMGEKVIVEHRELGVIS